MSKYFEGYSANRAKLLEFVKTWRHSELGERYYRDPSKRIAVEETVVAPWLGESTSVTVPSKWFDASTDDFEGGLFEDAASEVSAEELEELLTSYGYDETMIEAVASALVENQGKLLLLGKEGSTDAIAVTIKEGAMFVTEIEVEANAFLNETAVSIQHIAGTIGDPNAPVIPGFPPMELQNRLYEVLRSAALLSNTIAEDKSEARQTLNRFMEDLSVAIAEIALDEGSFTEEQAAAIYETFAGSFAGIQEEILSK